MFAVIYITSTPPTPMNTLASLNLSVPQFIAGFFVGIFILGVLSLLWHKSKEEKEHTKLAESLWQTGATRLLAQVWKLTGDAHHQSTIIGANGMLPHDIARAIWRASTADQHITSTVCGETVSATFRYWNMLFCQVEKAETKKAILDAHNLMVDSGKYPGTFPLTIQVSVKNQGVM